MARYAQHFVLDLQNYWHAGTGEAGAGDVDAVVLRDPDDLPYFPGKALKGLFSEAFCALAVEKAVSRAEILKLFGRPGSDAVNDQAQLRFASAELPRDEARQIIAEDLQAGLFEVLASTALGEDGLAKSRTLRRIEVAIPMRLGFTVEYHSREEDEALAGRVRQWLSEAASRIALAGAARHNGLGECRIELSGDGFQRLADPTASATATAPSPDNSDPLLRIPFEIETLEPVILGENAATVGPHACLDFLTGASLLGAFASVYYAKIAALGGDAVFHAFHSGAVRFGDGHPVDSTGNAALPLPLSWYYVKGESLLNERQPVNESYLYDLSRRERPAEENLVQARGQWLGSDARQVMVGQRRTLKSARDTAAFGRPNESQLFAYQYIKRGQRFAGEIHVRNDLTPRGVIEHLLGWLEQGPEITLGRSRSAEFGRCRLSSPAASAESTSAALPSAAGEPPPADDQRLRLYALSDLCLAGPEVVPQDGAAWHAALQGWSLDLERTHVRIREFSHWNGHRACPDPAIRAITRGSVITFRRDASGPAIDSAKLQAELDREGVGLHLQLGMGRVLVNPHFPKRGSAAEDSPPGRSEEAPTANETALVRVARRRTKQRLLDLYIDALAEAWQSDWQGFGPRPSPSQWSRIRQLTVTCQSLGPFGVSLEEMLNHGAAKKAWEGAQKDARNLAGELRDRANPANVQSYLQTLGSDRDVLDKKTGERLILRAVAEACRRLRQKS